MRRKKIGLALLATAMVAGAFPATAEIIDNGGIYTYRGNGYSFFTYNTTGSGATAITSDTWNYNQVSTLNGTRSNNHHFQQYLPGAYGNVDNQGNELMDGHYTVGANYNGTYSGDWTNPDPYIGGEGSWAIREQPWDNEQLFWNYVGNANSGTLHIGIVTGFNPNPALRQNFGAGDLFLSFGSSTSILPHPSADPNTTDPSGAGFYQVAIGTGQGRNTGSNEWILPTTWQDQDSDPFDFESDPYRYIEQPNTALDFADVEWSLGTGGNSHNFLAVAVELTNTVWIENLLSGGFTTHWTYGCGNDTIHHTALTLEEYTPVPVPAAAPMGLLGMVALGLFRKVRAKKS